MQPSTPSHICPTCQSPIPGDAPDGLCPACTLEKAAIGSPSITGASRPAAPAIAEITPHFPDLDVLELLGAGGMGAVYKARQPQLDRMVALKILSHDLAADPAFVERFNREAKLLARLGHPNIVAVFDSGKAGPYCYLLMEYVDGVNLRQAMRAGGFKPAEALALVQEICSALKFAHEEGILHRDIKPENILIDSKGRVKIADFGIAKMVGEGDRSNVTLTLQGSILGSPHYMAPEQIESPDDVDQRAEIYSLGVVLYEMLTGELPIGRFSPPSAKVAMDQRIDEIVFRTLEKERELRFQTVEEVRTEVGAIAQNPGTPRKESAPAAAGDAGVARFSLAAAILTGLSLVAILAGSYIGNEYRDLGLTRDNGKLLNLIMVILGSMSAITGFLFGCVALSSIRKSGGVLGGPGSSVFAVATWPVLLLGVLGMAFVKEPSPASRAGGEVGHMVILPVMGAALLLSAFVLVRGLIRWARGVNDKNGGQRFPGLASPILLAIGVMVLGLVSLEVAARVLPEREGVSDVTFEIMRDAALEEARSLSSRVPNASYRAENVEWSNGFPEALISVDIAYGTRADFRLVLDQGTGQAPQYTPIGTLLGIDIPGVTHASEVRDIRSTLEIGTSGSGTERGITGLFEFSGYGATLALDSAPNEWVFAPERNHVHLNAPEKITIKIATRKLSGKGGEEITGTLKLEINVTKR